MSLRNEQWDRSRRTKSGDCVKLIKTSERLGMRALARLPQTVRRPAFHPTQLQCGIVHLGIGAFHLAHQAVFTEDAIEKHGGSWALWAPHCNAPTARYACGIRLSL